MRLQPGGWSNVHSMPRPGYLLHTKSLHPAYIACRFMLMRGNFTITDYYRSFNTSWGQWEKLVWSWRMTTNLASPLLSYRRDTTLACFVPTLLTWWDLTAALVYIVGPPTRQMLYCIQLAIELFTKFIVGWNIWDTCNKIVFLTFFFPLKFVHMLNNCRLRIFPGIHEVCVY